MILQALYVYYQRKANIPNSDIPPLGLEWVNIPFIIMIDNDGNFVDINDTRELNGKKLIGKRFLVPHSVKRANDIEANLLWDNTAYVLGDHKTDQAVKVVKKHQAFLDKLNTYLNNPVTDPGITAVQKFYNKEQLKIIKQHKLWPEIYENNANLAFQLINENKLICQHDCVIEHIKQKYETKGKNQQICLITGVSSEIERIHFPIKHLQDAQSTGANIVSFNLEAFNSFDKLQGDNAPISKKAAFDYTTALNYLLDINSHQKLHVGDTTIVFWAEKANPIEDTLKEILGGDDFSKQVNDDTSANTNTVEAFYTAPQTGSDYWTNDKTLFYILGLVPNVSRIAIRFWHVCTVEDLAHNILQHFYDTNINHYEKAQTHLTITQLLRATAMQGDMRKIPPNLVGEMMTSILAGNTYPQTLLQAAIRRIRAEHNVTYPRAALLKAIINRYTRKSISTTEKEITMALDTSNSNPGYQLGRLFAVLEKTQMEALGIDINATIRDRFYGAASCTPVTAFPNLLKLNTHHLSKLENRGRAIKLEKLIGEIADKLKDFPATLSLPDQGRFALGYYHQRQNFYVKSDVLKQGE